jgi:hypothetical protein
VGLFGLWVFSRATTEGEETLQKRRVELPRC